MKKQSKYVRAIILLKASVAILEQNKVYEGDAELAKAYAELAKLEIDAVAI